MAAKKVTSVGDGVGDAWLIVANPADPALAAAHLVYALDLLGVTVVREPLDPARAARGEIPALHLRAASPRVLAAIPPELRAQIEPLRPALAEILEPSMLMTTTTHLGAALVARHDPAWGPLGPDAPSLLCKICDRPTVLAWSSPSGQRHPLHPRCVDPRDPAAALRARSGAEPLVPAPVPASPTPPLALATPADPLAFLGDLA